MGIAIPQVITNRSGAQVIDGSLKFDDDNKNYLTRTPGTTGNSKTFTFSAWTKGLNDGTFFCNGVASTGDNGLYIMITSNSFYVGTWTDSWQWYLDTNRLFRDDGWHHLVASVDTTQSTESDRVKLYVNGVQETSFATANYPSQNYNTLINNTAAHGIGRQGELDSGYIDKKLSQFYWIDGQQLGPENFGFTDPLTNTWKPKKYSGTFGTPVSWDGLPSGYSALDSSQYSGTLSNIESDDGNYITASNNHIDFDMGETITASGKFITAKWTSYVSDSFSADYRIETSNTSDFSTILENSETLASENTTDFKTVTLDLTQNFRYIRFSYEGGSRTARLHLLNVSGDGQNSFYLPMDGNSPIGKDQSGNGNDFTPVNFGGSVALDSSLVSGARPILNTTQGGAQAGVGVFGSKQNVGYAVTVYDDGGGNKYYIDGVKQATLTGLIRGATYTFDTSDSTIGSTHPFRLSATSAHGTEYTNGVAAITGAATTITIPHDAPESLYYYCTAHSGMGSSITGITTNEKLADQYASNCTLAAPLVGAADDVSVSIACTSTPKTATVTNANSSSAQSNFYSGSFDFDGSGDYISYGTSSEMDFGSGDCTVECWLFINSHAGDKTIVGSWEGNISWQLSYGATGDQNRFSFMMYNGSTTSANSSELSTNHARQWVHLAGVRNGNELQIWVNGKKDGTASFSGAHNSLNSAIRIGGRSSGNQTDAHIQDVRIYKGVAKYTSDFVIPATSPDILPDTPSGVSGGSKLTKITDGAVSFNGSDQYLSIADNADFTVGSDPFTIEFYAYKTESGEDFFCGSANSGGADSSMSYAVQTGGGSPSNSLRAHVGDGSSLTSVNSGVDFPTNRWVHIAFVRDGDTLRLFQDGVQMDTTSFSGTVKDSADPFMIGRGFGANSTKNFPGIISNFRFIKGTALYTKNFTPPSAPLTNVTNTKLLCCQSNTSATEAAVSPSTPTNGGSSAATNFNPFNTDINTVRGQETGYATLNPLNTMGDITLSDGNLHGKFTGSSSNRTCGGTIGVSTGNWYYEATLRVAGGSHPFCGFVTSISISPGTTSNLSVASMAGSVWTGNGGLSAGDVVGNILDFSGKVGMGATYYATINGVPVYSSSSTVKSEPTELTEGYKWIPAVSGLDNAEWEINFGQKPFKFPPPDGFQPLNAANTRPVKVISRPDQYVGVTTWSGTGATNSITGFNFNAKPDFVWIKKRAGGTARSHQLFDTVRGVHETLHSDTTGTQDTNSNRLTAFNRDGFTVGDDDGSNGSGGTFVSWCWKAGGSKNTFNVDDVGYASFADSGITAGTITPTGISVGTKQGFSIIRYDGAGTSTSATPSTIPHGLSQAPSFFMVKAISGDNAADDWFCYHQSLGASKRIRLNLNNAADAQSNLWGNETAPTSSVISINKGWYSANYTGHTHILYAWHDVPGLQKFGTYEANGSTDGPYVELGFKPAILMLKNFDDTEHWYVYDPERSPHNVAYQSLLWSNNGAENTGTSDTRVDLLSNGFKLRQANGPNTSGDGYIYAAWAAAPSIDLFGGGANAR